MKPVRRHVPVLVLLATMTLMSCDRDSAPESSQVPRTAEQIFSGSDGRKIAASIDGLGDPRREGPEGTEAYAVLEDIWRGRYAEHPGLDGSVLQTTPIRIKVANKLAQADRNQVRPLDPAIKEEMRAFAHAVLEATEPMPRDVETTVTALRALGFLNDAADVQTLHDFALETNSSPTRKNALLSLALMCDSAAGPAMDDAIDKLDTLLDTAFVADLRRSRRIVLAGQCANPRSPAPY